MHKEAIRNIEISPYYQNYRFLVTEPMLKTLYREQEFQRLLDRSYADWARTLAELKDTLPAQPPNLLSPGEFLASQGVSVSK
jgi:hypothetical protein